MGTIVVAIEDKKHNYTYPEDFKSMSQEQFLAAVDYIVKKESQQPVLDSFLSVMIGIEKKNLDLFSEYDKYCLLNLFEWLIQSRQCSSQLIQSIELNKKTFIGYQDSFANTTWEEFIYADQFLINKNYRAMAAVLYRQQRDDYDGETDRRVVFSKYGTDTRMQYFCNIDEILLSAILLNYTMMRKTCLEDKYTLVFPYYDKEAAGEENQETTSGGSFSWLNVHRSLLGDKLYQEENILKLNVNTVLKRMNTVLLENRKNKKHAGRQ